MPTYIRNGVDFTGKAWNDFYDIVGAVDFSGREEDAIYNALKKIDIKIDFGHYLKRYIYRKTIITQPFEDVPLEEYIKTIAAMFKDNQTPSSFDGETKLKLAITNWLTRKSVSRKTVLLLGFGLSMTVDEVNSFLAKGICEQKLNPKDPFEVICRYCYANRLGYYDFEELMHEYDRLLPAINQVSTDDHTGIFYSSVQQLTNKKELMEYLSQLKDICGVSKYSRTAKRNFVELYDSAKKLIADKFSGNESHSSAENVTVSDIENIIYEGIPKNPTTHNLKSECECNLADLFYGKRLSRHRIGKIIGKNDSGKQETEVTRFDLITLNFFVYSQKLEEYPDTKTRFNAFYEHTNRILEQCFMHELIIQNPYENFVLGCMLAEDPLDAFIGVWEKTYSEQ